MAKGTRPRCPVCQSKKWHRDGLSGSVVCEEGHLLQGYVQESIEAQEASQYATQTRHIRKKRAKALKPPSNAQYHGARATFLLHQAMQLVLRQQVALLIAHEGWPAETEHVVRDLWAMLCASLKVPDAPGDFDRGDEEMGSYSGPRPGARYVRKGRPKGKKHERAKSEEEDMFDLKSDEEDVLPDQPSSANTSDADVESDDDEERTPSAVGDAPSSSQKEKGKVTSGNPFDAERKSKAHLRPKLRLDVREGLQLDFTLLVLYLAALTLRLPIFLKDLLDMAETFRLPYLESTNHLPFEMVQHLNQSSQKILDAHTVPDLGIAGDAKSIQTWLAKLVAMYEEDWGVRFPEANVPLIAWRTLRSLALPPTFYMGLKDLLAMLPTNNFTPAPYQDFSTRKKASDAESRGRGWVPEALVAAGAVTLLRLSWANWEDNIEEEGKPLLPPMKDFLFALSSLEKLDKNSLGDPRRLWQKDVGSMSGDEMDCFLDFFETHVVPKHPVAQNKYHAAISLKLSDLNTHFPPLPQPAPVPSPASSDLQASIDALLTRLYSVPHDPTDPAPSATDIDTALSYVLARAASLTGVSGEQIEDLSAFWWRVLLKEERIDNPPAPTKQRGTLGRSEEEKRGEEEEEEDAVRKREERTRWEEEKKRRKELDARMDVLLGKKRKKPRKAKKEQGDSAGEERDPGLRRDLAGLEEEGDNGLAADMELD